MKTKQGESRYRQLAAQIEWVDDAPIKKEIKTLTLNETITQLRVGKGKKMTCRIN